VGGVDVEVSLLVAHNRGNRICLNDQVSLQSQRFVARRERDRLVVVPDRDQISHATVLTVT